MRPRVLLLCAPAVLALALAACGPSHGDDDNNGGNCPNLCTALGWQRCESPGVYDPPVACEADQTCVPDVGCTVCMPEQLYCGADNQVWQCNGDGTGGSMVMTCDAGNVCSDGACKTPCERALDEPSNVGCDFWAVDLDNEAVSNFITNDAAAQQYSVVVANNNDYDVQVQVLDNAGRVGAPLDEQVVIDATVGPRSVRQLDLPQREVDGTMGQNGAYRRGTGSHTFVSPHGYHVITSGPVVAYQFNPIIQQFSNDASTLIPIQALGRHHYVFGWPTANPCGPPPGQFGYMDSIPDHTAITIVGVEDDTQVTVTATHPITGSGGDSGFVVPPTPAGTPLTFTVNRYDVVNLESDQPMVPIQECLSHLDQDGDFTGSLVTSTKKVAVFTALERGIGLGGATPPDPPGWDGDGCCTDHLEEQLFPTTAWGHEFAIARSPVRSTDPSYQEPDVYRVLASEDGTQVTTNLGGDQASFTLDAGQYKPLWADRGFTMKSTAPVTVGQVLVSQNRIPQGGIGDPSLLLVPAAEQYRKSYVFLVPSTFEKNYMVLAKPVLGDFSVDGRSLGEFSDCTRGPVGTVEGIDYEQVTCPVSEGGHTVEGNLPFGLFVYGYYSVGSYSFAGGSDVKIINPID
ncbi:MAG TPA: IgGFc-binding protein [Kofleriaceae bacterium]|nr:IgGFc-binding protein [Kofleriaceae bacterium]